MAFRVLCLIALGFIAVLAEETGNTSIPASPPKADEEGAAEVVPPRGSQRAKDVLSRLKSAAQTLEERAKSHNATNTKAVEAHDLTMAAHEALLAELAKDFNEISHYRAKAKQGGAAGGASAGSLVPSQTAAGSASGGSSGFPGGASGGGGLVRQWGGGRGGGRSLWSDASMEEFLAPLGLEAYEPVLAREGFGSVSSLRFASVNLTAQQLAKWGLHSKMHREMLLSSLAALRAAALHVLVVRAFDLPRPQGLRLPPGLREPAYYVETTWKGHTRCTPRVDGPRVEFPGVGGSRLSFPAHDVSAFGAFPVPGGAALLGPPPKPLKPQWGAALEPAHRALTTAAAGMVEALTTAAAGVVGRVGPHEAGAHKAGTRFIEAAAEKEEADEDEEEEEERGGVEDGSVLEFRLIDARRAGRVTCRQSGRGGQQACGMDSGQVCTWRLEARDVPAFEGHAHAQESSLFSLRCGILVVKPWLDWRQ